MWVQKITGGGVDALAYAPDGRTLYVADRGGAVTAWDVANQTSRRLFHLNALRRLAVTADHYLATTSYMSVYIWDATGRQIARQPIHNPQDDLPVTGDGRVVYQSADRLSLLSRRPGDAGEGEPLAGPFGRPVRAYDLSPDGRTLAFASDFSRTLGLFNVADRAVAGSLELDSGMIWGVRFAPDGQALAAFSGSQIRLCDVEPLACRAGRVNSDNRYGKSTFAFHPTAALFVALNSDGLLTLFSATTGEAVRSLDFALGRRVRCAAFSPDGLTCAVGGSNKQFTVFDVDA